MVWSEWCVAYRTTLPARMLSLLSLRPLVSLPDMLTSTLGNSGVYSGFNSTVSAGSMVYGQTEETLNTHILTTPNV